MATYLMMLYVSLEQEEAVKDFFKGKGWYFRKPDLSVTTDKTGPPLIQLTATTAQTQIEPSVKLPRGKQAKSTPKVKLTPKLSNRKGKSKASAEQKKKDNTEMQEILQEAAVISASINRTETAEEGETQIAEIKVERDYTVESNDNVDDDNFDDYDDYNDEQTDGVMPSTSQIEGDSETGMPDLSETTPTAMKKRKISETDTGIAAKLSDDDWARQETPVKVKEGSPSTQHSQHSGTLSLPAQDSMTDTYSMAQRELLHVNEAVRQHSVAQQPLQTREAGKSESNGTVAGQSTESVFTKQEEQNIVEFLTTLYSLGYGFSRYDMMTVAREYALYLKKGTDEKPISDNKIFKVVRSLPELRVIYKRCTMSLSTILSSFFDRLEKVMVEHSFSNTPQLVFSVIDIEIRQDEAASQDDQILATIIACGNAAGQSIPPFFVFQGQEMTQDLMHKALPGSSGIVSANGLVNAEVFIQFLTEHLLRNVSEEDMGKPILVHVNGVKFCSVGLLELAKARNIHLIFPPIEISNALMPLDIGCIEPFQEVYTTECEKHMETTMSDIAIHNVSEVVSKVYPKALSSANISEGFRKAGLFPCNRHMLIVKGTD